MEPLPRDKPAPLRDAAPLWFTTTSALKRLRCPGTVTAPCCLDFLSSASRKHLQRLVLVKPGATSPRLQAVPVPSLADCSALALVRCATFTPSPSLVPPTLLQLAQGFLSHSPSSATGRVWPSLACRMPTPYCQAFLNIPDASAPFCRTYTQTLKTTKPLERWISILWSLVVSCGHTNSSYAENCSDCCNDSLGQGRDHRLKSLMENSCI